MNLQTSVSVLKGVGERRFAALQRLDLRTLGDLICHVPRGYEDWQTLCSIQSAPQDRPCCLRATVQHAPTTRNLRSGMTLYQTLITDGETELQVTIFNSEYVANQLRTGDTYLFFGKVTQAYGHETQYEMASPQIAAPDEARLRPLYPLTEGLSHKVLEGLIEQALHETASHIKEFLPSAVLEQYELIPRLTAFQQIHHPTSPESAEAARRRLAFNELYTLQVGLRRLRLQAASVPAPPLPALPALEFLRQLPFTATDAQIRAVTQAAQDMAQTHPMQRLLQGDVGSGKTAVAAALLAQTRAAGHQGALLAPTELLARQHQQTLTKLGLPTELLLSATPAKEKRRIKERLVSGEISLIVGTHALLQPDVLFQSLAFLVVDEQHRFGVQQRGLLRGQSHGVHVLAMSATPIPRSLGLILYGDLDLSILDELPPGRQPIATFSVSSQLRARAYAYIKKHLDAGQQGYLVCARVSETDSERASLASAEQYNQQLQSSEFRDYRLGLLHGKLSAKKKEEVMEKFVSGEVQLLVATTVVEVGVDVPNATIILVENAECFGLSQLHQLRGRVGRGTDPSTCILLSDSDNPKTTARLQIMTETNDGFRIARKDLELRGPGAFLGAQQHGLPPLRLAHCFSADAADTRLLEQTKAAAAAADLEDSGAFRNSGNSGNEKNTFFFL